MNLKPSENRLNSSVSRNNIALELHNKAIQARQFNATKYYKYIVLHAVTQCLKWASQSKTLSFAQQRVAKELLESLRVSGLLARFGTQWNQRARSTSLSVLLMLSYAQLSYACANMGLFVAEPAVSYLTDSSVKKDFTLLLRSIGFYIESLQLATSMVVRLYDLYPFFVETGSAQVTVQGSLRMGLEISHFLSTPACFLEKQCFHLKRAEGRAPMSLLTILAEDLSWMLSHPGTSFALGLYSNIPLLRDVMGFLLSKCSLTQRVWLESIAKKYDGLGLNDPKILEDCRKNVDGMTLLISSLVVSSVLWRYLLERRTQNVLHNAQTMLSLVSQERMTADAGNFQRHRFFQEKSVKHEEHEIHQTTHTAFVNQVHRVIYCVVGTVLLTQPFTGISFFLTSLISGLTYVNQSLAAGEEIDTALQARSTASK